MIVTVQPKKRQKHYTPQVGCLYHFNGHDYLVLDIQDDKALLLSDFSIIQRVYHDELTDVTWEKSWVRHYLNTDFFCRLKRKNRKKIIKTRIKNHDNLWHGTKGGNDTHDKIFLLSLDEVDKYFGNSGDYQNKRQQVHPIGQDKPYYDGLCINNDYNKDRVALATFVNLGHFFDMNCAWWLRSPGKCSSKAAYVDIDGIVCVDGYDVYDYTPYDNDGIRPAFWIRLNPPIIRFFKKYFRRK